MFFGLDAEDAGVASWARGVAFADGTEESGEEFMGCLGGWDLVSFGFLWIVMLMFVGGRGW